MLTYAETASSSTIVPVEAVPSSQQQERPIDPSTSLPFSGSYAIGPLDPAQFSTLHARLATGAECCLLIPLHLPLWFLHDPQFKEGYEAGYLDPETEEGWSVPQIVNWTYHFIQRELDFDEAWEDFGLHLPAWIVGCLLGDLAGLAETERTLALVGVAHLAFLLPFLTLDSPFWPPVNLYRADFPHRMALRAYRARVRSYREQGKCFEEAQRLALVANEQ
jgi:hypothetical protein